MKSPSQRCELSERESEGLARMTGLSGVCLSDVTTHPFYTTFVSCS